MANECDRLMWNALLVGGVEILIFHWTDPVFNLSHLIQYLEIYILNCGKVFVSFAIKLISKTVTNCPDYEIFCHLGW